MTETVCIQFLWGKILRVPQNWIFPSTALSDHIACHLIGYLGFWNGIIYILSDCLVLDHLSSFTFDLIAVNIGGGSWFFPCPVSEKLDNFHCRRRGGHTHPNAKELREESSYYGSLPMVIGRNTRFPFETCENKDRIVFLFTQHIFINYLGMSYNVTWSHSLPIPPMSTLLPLSPPKKEKKIKKPCLICVFHLLTGALPNSQWPALKHNWDLSYSSNQKSSAVKSYTSAPLSQLQACGSFLNLKMEK